MAKKKKHKVEGLEFLVCSNPNASKRYDIEYRMEAGLVLVGSEVKSMRAGRADLDGAYASIDRGEAFINSMHVAPYEQAGPFGHEPKRKRKLLLHRREIEKIQGRLVQRGFALVPTQVYFKNGVAKIELAMGKGKKIHDNRESIKRDIAMKEARDAVGRRQR